VQRIRLDQHTLELQDAKQGFEGRTLVGFAGVKRGLANRRLGGHVQQEEQQMVRRQPLHWRGRQQQRLLRVPGRKVLGLLMPHFPAQIHCCHLDLGRYQSVCGEAGGGVVRDRLIAAMGRPVKMKRLPEDTL